MSVSPGEQALRNGEANLEFDSSVVDRFRAAFDKYEGLPFHIIRAEDIPLVHNGHRPEIDPIDYPDGIHMTQEFSQMFEINMGQQPEAIAFSDERLHLMRLGKENSLRSVFFGTMSFYCGDDCNEIKMPVAIKPFESSHYRVFNELAMNNYVAGLGIDTFNAVMMIKDNNKAWLVTAYEAGVTTFDNTSWFESGDDPEFQDRISRRLEIIADHQARMHAAKVLHRDSQVKNFAHREKISDTVAMDLETASSFRDVDHNDQYARDLFVMETLTLYQSLINASYLEGQLPEDQFVHFNEHFIQPYRETLLGLVPDEEKDWYSEMLEATEEEIMDLSFSIDEEEFGVLGESTPEIPDAVKGLFALLDRDDEN